MATRLWPIVVAVALALAVASVSVRDIGVAVSQSEQSAAVPGVAVPTALRQPIEVAALSCPTLTPARLSAQVMAATRFNVSASTPGGSADVAGLSTAAWRRWAPAPQAVRTDSATDVLALAHDMCDLVGQVRVANIPGDRWQLALAAYHVGFAAVKAATGVPSTATAYVDEVVGYAAWYQASQDSPGPSPSVVTASPGTDFGSAIAVPAADLSLIEAAGKVCPTVTPSRIAGQLMAASGFQANLLGTTGAQGIAQFLPEIWAQYAPSGSASPWDPAAAIPALGTAMCDLVNQFTSLGADPYRLALAAFWWGPVAVRQAGVVPRSDGGIQAYVNAALNYADAYATNPALSAGRLVTGSSPSAGPPTTAPPKPSPSLQTAPGEPSVAPPPPTTQWTEATFQATGVLKRGQSVQSNRTRLVMDDSGDLAVYDENNLRRWDTGTGGRGYQAVFQADGNLVVYDQNGAGLWTSNTAGHSGAVLVLEKDGNVCVVYQGIVIWAANTAH